MRSRVALDDVERQQRLVAGALQVERVLGAAAAADREREAGQPGLELAQDRRGDPPAGLAVAVGDEHHDLAGVGLGRRGDRARGDRARAAGGDREQPPAPVVLGRACAAWARTTATLAAARRGRSRAPCRGRAGRRGPRSAARAPRAGSSSPPPRRRARARGRARPRRRSASSPGAAARRRALSLAAAHPQLADRGLGDLELDRRDVVGVAHQRALVGGRARGDGEHRRRAVDQDQAGVERAGGGAEDLGQAGAGLDRVGDRRERAEVGARARPRAAALGAFRQLARPRARVRRAAATRARSARPSRTPMPTSAASTYSDRTTTATRSQRPAVGGDRGHEHERAERGQAEHAAGRRRRGR